MRPEDRYASARALAVDIDRWLADEPVAVYREPLSLRLTRWGRRRRTLATGIGVLLITAVIGLSLGTILLGHANERTRSESLFAAEQWRRAELKTREASDKAEALHWQLYVNRINLAQRDAVTDVAHAEQLLDQCPPVQRGWEWNLVKRFCHMESRSLAGHTRPVNTVAFSPDGRLIVSGAGEQYYDSRITHDAELTVWDARTGRSLRSLTGLKGAVKSAAFSPDGNLIAVGSGYQRVANIFDGHLSVWDAQSGRLKSDHEEAGNNPLSVAFSPDGQSIGVGYGKYSSNDPGRFTLWDANTGKSQATIAPTRGGVNCVAFSPDGRVVALACSGVVELWQVKAFQKVRARRSQWLGLRCGLQPGRHATRDRRLGQDAQDLGGRDRHSPRYRRGAQRICQRGGVQSRRQVARVLRQRPGLVHLGFENGEPAVQFARTHDGNRGASFQSRWRDGCHG